MRKSASLLVGVILSLGFAPAPLPKPDSTKTELKKLQGTWIRVRCTLSGQLMTTGPQGNIRAVINGNRLQYVQDGSSTTDWALTVDARKKPKVFDIKGITPSISTFTFLGVYRLEGDTLIVSSRRTTNDNERPADFDGSKRGVYIEIFKRGK
jgi:uncharacterized protein (TIGR03067 family)